MSSGKDNMRTALRSAEEQELRPLADECAEVLGLDSSQVAELELSLREAWFFGIRTGHKVMVETRMGQKDAAPVIASMQDEFQDLMERLAEALDTTVGATVRAWSYLGRAWMAGAKFWEVEIAARLIEARSGGLDDGSLGWLED
jgi:hypothetical protein